MYLWKEDCTIIAGLYNHCWMVQSLLDYTVMSIMVFLTCLRWYSACIQTVAYTRDFVLYFCVFLCKSDPALLHVQNSKTFSPSKSFFYQTELCTETFTWIKLRFESVVLKTSFERSLVFGTIPALFKLRSMVKSKKFCQYGITLCAYWAVAIQYVAFVRNLWNGLVPFFFVEKNGFGREKL